MWLSHYVRNLLALVEDLADVIIIVKHVTCNSTFGVLFLIDIAENLQ